VSPGIIGLESINSDAILDWGNPLKEIYVIARRDGKENETLKHSNAPGYKV